MLVLELETKFWVKTIQSSLLADFWLSYPWEWKRENWILDCLEDFREEILLSSSPRLSTINCPCSAKRLISLSPIELALEDASRFFYFKNWVFFWLFFSTFREWILSRMHSWSPSQLTPISQRSSWLRSSIISPVIWLALNC